MINTQQDLNHPNQISKSECAHTQIPEDNTNGRKAIYLQEGDLMLLVSSPTTWQDNRNYLSNREQVERGEVKKDDDGYSIPT